jgi:quinohemoprotein ethanol dehydrogenase
MKRPKVFVLLVLLAVAGAGCFDCAAATSLSEDGSSEAGDWTNFGRDGSEQHYSPLNEISLKNVGQLNLAWYYDLEPGFSVSTPVKAGTKLFTTTSHSHIRAFDLASQSGKRVSLN